MKNKILIILIIFKISVFAKENTDIEKEYLNTALENLKKGNIKDCFINSDKVLKNNPDNILALLLRSKCYLFMEKYDTALKDTNKALELIAKSDDKDDKNEDLIYVKQELIRIKGIIYDKQGKYEQAVKELLEAINLGKNDASIYFDIAIVYNNLKKYDMALKYTEIAIDLNPFYESYYNSAIYLINTLKIDKDLTYYKERSFLLKNNSNVFYSKISSLLNHMPLKDYENINGQEMYYEIIFDNKGEQILPDIVPFINIDYVMELTLFYEIFTGKTGNYELIRENSILKKNKKVRIKAMRIETYYEDLLTKDLHFIYKIKVEDAN